jgi:hypothetical protein
VWPSPRDRLSHDRVRHPVDVDLLRGEIRRTYTDVSTDQEREFIFPTGRGWARELDYPEPELARVPDATVESFAGVANHSSPARSCSTSAAAPAPTS